MVVGVLVQLASQNVDKIFDYSVPKELEDSMQVGITIWQTNIRRLCFGN